MLKILQGTLLVAASLLALLMLFISFFLLYRAYRQKRIKSATELRGARSIEELRPVTIRGLEQWIYIRGEDRDRPVILFLQDGLLPMIYRARRFGHATGLEQDYTIVYWDKRGEGRSFRSRERAESFDTADYVEDTLALTLFLKEYLNKEQIYLMGHSGGSEIGLFSVHSYPQHYAAYVGIGQVVNYLQCTKDSLNWLEERLTESGQLEKREQLKALGEPPFTTFKDELAYYNLKVEAGGMHYSADYGKGDNRRMFEDLLFSPEYSLRDLLAFFKDPFWLHSYKLEKGALYDKDLSTMINKVDLPVHFIQGRYDRGTSYQTLLPYYETLQAAEKGLTIFEQSGHYPCYEQPERFRQVINELLQ